VTVKTRLFPLLALILCVQLAPSASASRIRDEVDLLSRDLRELQQLFEAERTRNAALEAQLADLRRLTGVDDAGRLSAADLGARLDGLDHDVQVIYENQNETRARLSVLTDQVDALFRHQAIFGGAPAQEGAMVTGGEAAAATGAEALSADAPGSDSTGLPAAPPVPGSVIEFGDAGGAGMTPRVPGGSAPPVLLDPEELYRAARADYGRGDYALAIEGFDEFLSRFPASELADNSQYWIGESHWAGREHEKALAAFDAVLQQFPDGDKASDAGLKRGLCLIELNRMADGIIQLQHVKDAYPGTAASRLAREKLESLGLM